ncbi:MAG: relaxase/mobilization nuclease domain-containing protein [Mobilitalea sp.]
MAISKSIPIRAAKPADRVGNAINYIMDESKTSTEVYNTNRNMDITENNLDNAFTYIGNPEKTTTNEKVVLVSGFRCNPTTAATEFKIISDRYHLAKSEHISNDEVFCKGNKKSSGKLKNSREAYHFIQSFPKGLQIEESLVHHIGTEFGKRLGGEEFQFVCSTHLNTDCLHNHIVMNAYNLDNLSKYRDSKSNLHRMRRINDDLSREFGLPVLLGTENNKGKNYAEIVAVQEGVSWKNIVCIDIQNAKKSSYSWNDYKNIMEGSGYRIQENKKSITYILPDDKKIMDKTLGQEYTKDKLEEHWDKIHDDSKGNLSQHIIDEMTVLHQKRINNYINSINIRVYRYTFCGRRRSDLEMLLIFAFKVLFSIVGLLKLLFSNSEQSEQNPLFKSVEGKIKNLTEVLVQLEELNIRNGTELEKQLKEGRANTYQLQKEVDRLTNQTKNYSDLIDNVTVVKYLQARMDDMGLNQETLGIVPSDETVIRKNKAVLDPMSPIQRRNLFLAISDSKSYRLIYKYDEITASQVGEIIDFLKSPKTKEKPTMIITMEEFENIRKRKMQDTIQNRKMGIRTRQEEADNSEYINSEQDYSKLLQTYNSEDRALILKYRDALNNLLRFGIDDIGLVEEKYNDILKTLEQKEQELRLLDERSKQLSQIKSVIGFADNKQYLYGPFYDILKNKDFKEKTEIVEAAEGHNWQKSAMCDLMEEEIISKAR